MSYWMGANISKNVGISREASGPERAKLSDEEREGVNKRLNRRRKEKTKAGKRSYQSHK